MHHVSCVVIAGPGKAQAFAVCIYIYIYVCVPDGVVLKVAQHMLTWCGVPTHGASEVEAAMLAAMAHGSLELFTKWSQRVTQTEL